MTARRDAWPTVLICLGAAVLEGVDLQALGLAATGIIADFQLRPSDLGLLGGAGSVGLFVGAGLGGWLADRIGRKPVMVGAVMLFGLFSLALPFAWDLDSLMAARLMTGVGIGAALPVLIAVCAEAAAPGRRTSMVTLMYTGAATGGGAGGPGPQRRAGAALHPAGPAGRGAGGAGPAEAPDRGGLVARGGRRFL